MKNKLLLLPALASCVLALSAPVTTFAEPVSKENIQIMNAINTDDVIRPHQSAFPDQVRANLIKRFNKSLDLRKTITIFGKNQTWQSLDKIKSLTEPGIQMMRLELSTDRFTTGTLKIEGVQTGTLYHNGTKVDGDGEYSLSLYNGEHRLLFLAEQVDNWKKVSIDYTPDDEAHQVTFHKTSPKYRLNAKQMFDAQTVSRASISPDGKHLVWTKRQYNDDNGNKSVSTTELVEVKTMKVRYRWQGMTPGTVNWSPDNRYISFTKGYNLFLLERQTLTLSQIASNLEGAYGYKWLNDDSIVFTWSRAADSEHEITKHYRAIEDRWGGWRDTAQIYQLDIQSGFIKQLTESKLSLSLVAIKPDGKKLLLMRSPIDYKAPPHVLTELIEFDVKKQSEHVIGKYREINSAAYASQGIFILAGPSFANGAGKAKDVDKVVNNYDTQLYLADKKGKISALSRDFNPSINSMKVMQNGDLLLRVGDQDRTLLYTYSPKRNNYKRVNTQLDVVDSYSVSREKKPSILYYGTSALSPQKSFIVKPGKKARLLVDTAKLDYRYTNFGTIKDYDFTNDKGELIDGRYYLPPNFDANKKYPTIVYYYGGTSPVGRSFTGRWPFSLWAAQGYIVYVVQPSGATGYGQKFSAKHVNAWGKDTAQDVIDATNAFVKDHKFVDGSKLANMGASYGGFMTMYLATKTDMFSASISHAGISNLAEYWGYGWWGYAYSGIASEGSFPWNNRDLYVKQSPLYSADKITTPLLLIHGDSDTNVPVTESHQMYTALKILGRDVDLIEFKGDDHHINSRDHRLRWWATIMAYLDNKLKDQPLWWDTMYPGK